MYIYNMVSTLGAQPISLAIDLRNCELLDRRRYDGPDIVISGFRIQSHTLEHEHSQNNTIEWWGLIASMGNGD